MLPLGSGGFSFRASGWELVDCCSAVLDKTVMPSVDGTVP